MKFILARNRGNLYSFFAINGIVVIMDIAILASAFETLWRSSVFPVRLTYFSRVFYVQTVYVSDVFPVLLLLKISIKI